MVDAPSNTERCQLARAAELGERGVEILSLSPVRRWCVVKVGRGGKWLFGQPIRSFHDVHGALNLPSRSFCLEERGRLHFWDHEIGKFWIWGNYGRPVYDNMDEQTTRIMGGRKHSPYNEIYLLTEHHPSTETADYFF